MLQLKVEQLEEKLLHRVLADAFYWLIETFGDSSVKLNKPNYTKKYSCFKPYVFKHHLELVWNYNPKNLFHHYEGQWAEYQSGSNRIYLYCDKRHTLEFTLECLFHEYKHTQQNMYLYIYYCNHHKVAYENHPLEKEANDFAAQYVPIFWKEYSAKVVN